MQGFSLIPPLHQSRRATVANHSADLVYHSITNHSDSQACKPITQSPNQKGEELHLNVRGALLDKGMGSE